MYAIIARVAESPDAGLFSIAGRPLVSRQLQWLREIQCRRVAVQIGTDAPSMAVAAWLSEHDALGADVALVLAAAPLSPRGVARRAGFPDGIPLVVVPATVLGGGDLAPMIAAAPPRGLVIRLDPPEAVAARVEPGVVRVLGPSDTGDPRMSSDAGDPRASSDARDPRMSSDAGDPRMSSDARDPRMSSDAREPRVEEVVGPSWGALIRSQADALALSAAVLSGRISSDPADGPRAIIVHAAERSPGVWAGRGALIARTAELTPPVFVGARAIVCSGARVGPSVVIGGDAVVESGAALSHAVVHDDTIVGVGVSFSHVELAPHRAVRLADRARLDVHDALVLGQRGGAPAPGLLARALALALLVLLAPLGALASLVSYLLGRGAAARIEVPAAPAPITLVEGATGVAPLDAVLRLWDVALGRRFLVGLSPWKEGRPEGASDALLFDALAVPYGLVTIDAGLTHPGADAETRLRARLWYAREKGWLVDAALVLRCLGCALGRGPAAAPVPRAPAVEIP
ncbi:hypothetical protein [Sorangium sp. So ce513]|uniref:hypothetical protein n=1 Tax=Sorangium sp. So ce513 TaxID=3133315 RepID=UPI003F614D30